MIKLKYVELHNPHFLAGINLAQKLDVTKRSGLVLSFHEWAVFVELNGQLSVIPLSNVASMHPFDPADFGYEIINPKVQPQALPAPVTTIKPQASTPHDHVFAGPGAGKVRN